MRDRRSFRAGGRRDRDRRLSRISTRNLLAGRPLRRVHRLRGGRPRPETCDPRHLHHPSQGSDPARHHRGHDAGQLLGEQRHLFGHARGDRMERARPCRGAGRDRRMVSAGPGRREYRRAGQAGYRGSAKQVANALWGSSAAHVRYKHVTVVDDDIDIHDYAAVDWAIAFRVNAGEDDIVIMPSTFGAGLDPSVRRRDRNVAQFGTGKWNRVLIDATINLDYDPDPDLGGARFPPTVRPQQKDIDAVMARWSELGSWTRQNADRCLLVDPGPAWERETKTGEEFRMRIALRVVAALSALALGTSASLAQSWPSKPIRAIVPFTPAARPISFRARCWNKFPRNSANPSWSRTAPAAARRSACCWSRVPSPTATRFWSCPMRSFLRQRSRPMPATIRCATFPRSRCSAMCRWC